MLASRLGGRRPVGPYRFGPRTSKATTRLLDDATDAVDPSPAPSGVAYEKWTKSDLSDRAQELDIDGRSAMSKKQLIAALRSA